MLEETSSHYFKMVHSLTRVTNDPCKANFANCPLGVIKFYEQSVYC